MSGNLWGVCVQLGHLAEHLSGRLSPPTCTFHCFWREFFSSLQHSDQKEIENIPRTCAELSHFSRQGGCSAQQSWCRSCFSCEVSRVVRLCGCPPPTSCACASARWIATISGNPWELGLGQPGNSNCLHDKVISKGSSQKKMDYVGIFTTFTFSLIPIWPPELGRAVAKMMWECDESPPPPLGKIPT